MNIISSIYIGQLKVPYTLEWSEKRDTVGIRVTSNHELRVRSPVGYDKEKIEEILEDKKPWILEKLNRVEEETWPPKNKEFLSGEKLLYNGRRYLMKVKKGGNTEIDFTGDRFHITSSNYKDDSTRRREIAREVKEWYQQKASEELIERTHKFSEEVGKDPEEVRITEYENKWGENRAGEIKLHWKLILAPQEIQDYVIAHELCHLKRQDHSKMFWNTLGSIIPDYERRREWLRTNGQKLTV